MPSRDPARYMRERRAAHPRLSLGDHLMKAYGLTLEQYDTLVRSQDSRCAVCNRLPKSGQRLHVDHDHETGLVRALLCSPCNSALGLMGESPEQLQALVWYAEHWIQARAAYTADPERYALAQAFKQNPNTPKLTQLIREAIQRLNSYPPVQQGHRGRVIAKALEELAAARRVEIPEVAPVRAGDAGEAVYV
jgi:hypothetical protein